MQSLMDLFRTVKSHYKLFGSGGITFLYHKRKKNSLISINVPSFSQPIFLRNSTEDIPMFYLIFQAKDYDFDCDFKPKVILDCGAHIGLAAVFFANKFPDAKIFCVEPEKSNYELLVKNTGSYPNIKCIHSGVWSKTTNLKIIDAGLGNWGFITEETDYPDNDTIPAISIDEIMSRYNLSQIDICKINVEGTEKELFDNNYENWVPKTKLILIELHDRIKEGCSKSFFKALINYKFCLSNRGPYLLTRILSSEAEPFNSIISAEENKILKCLV